MIPKFDKYLTEAMVQIAGKDKPSGAKVLAQVIIADLVEKGYMKLVTNKRELSLFNFLL